MAETKAEEVCVSTGEEEDVSAVNDSAEDCEVVVTEETFQWTKMKRGFGMR